MNTIAEHIADFLKKYPPFDNLNFQELAEIATSIRVINLEKHKILFNTNDVLHDSADAEETLINRCVEGNVFGLRPFFAKNNYMMNAKAREESIIYAIPITTFKTFVTNNPNVMDYLLQSFASTSSNPNEIEHLQGKMISDNVFYSHQKSEMQFFQTLSYNTVPLKISESSIVQEVAQLMTNAVTNSAIVCQNDLPIGIVTHTDMSTKIATGRYAITTSVDKIMSSPVVTIMENVSLAEAQLLMLKYNVTHLCVTNDGTDKSAIKGIISEHDLIVAQASNPGVLIKEIKRSKSSQDLKVIRKRLTDLVQKSLHKNISLSHINNIASEINLAIIKRSVDLSILDLGSPPVRFAWLSIGSQGRKEQLLPTDQDSILVFEDVTPDKYRDVKDYFLKLAKRTTSNLEIIGYAIPAQGHVASNMLWCKSLTDWTKQYINWTNTPGENSNEISSVFFDIEIATGEQKLEEAIQNVIFNNVKNNVLFFDFLGNDALKKNSPLTFFKNFNVEELGVNKDKFDINTRALMPLIDAARLFSLSYSIKGVNNTYLRFKQLSIIDPRNSEIYLNCAEAFLILSKFRTLEGLKNDSSGQFINLQELSKADKEHFKNAFAPMRELEELLKTKFKLTQFS
jgi:CBS domain-containing protein